MFKFTLHLSLWIFCLFINSVALKNDVHIQNLDSICMRCLCQAATNCDMDKNCNAGYCGPFKISKIYWVDADRLVLDNDDAERDGAFNDCAYDYNCASNIVKNYLAKYGKDCNRDLVTNCADYSMINFNGGWSCDDTLQRNEAGRNWTNRYNNCVGSHSNLRL